MIQITIKEEDNLKVAAWLMQNGIEYSSNPMSLMEETNTPTEPKEGSTTHLRSKEEIEAMAELWADEYYDRNIDSVNSITEHDQWDNRRYNFIEGYKAAQQKNEQPSDAIEFHKWMKENDTPERAEEWFHYSDEDMYKAFLNTKNK